MAENPQFYIYRPLDHQHQGFRVAILQPALEFSAPICCNLVEVTVDSHPDYEAISYVWGNPENQAVLRVEDAELKVTVNLELALRYLRLSHEPRTLWVDAICIDQNNIDERNWQVQLMKNIYSSCVRDLIWLGTAQEDTEIAIASLAHMESLNLRRWTGTKDFDNRIALRELGIDDAEPIESIIARPRLWERVWVMQEIACCSEAMLVIGHFSMPWTILSSILDHSGIPDRYHLPFSHQLFEQDIWDAFAKTQVIEHQRDIIKGTSRLNSTLLDVLSRFRATYSTDPRDKIYGLLGLATDNPDIVPDYKKSVRDVYIDVARSQFNATQNLDLITQSLWPLGNAVKPYSHSNSGSPAAGDTIDLPSWLPNFTATEARKILFAQRSIFAAGTPTCTQPIVISPAGVLTISGSILATIMTLKPVRKMVYSDGQYFSLWARDWLPDSLSTSNSTGAFQSYPTGGDAFEAYWRTLMTDCIAYPSRRLSDGDLEEYARLFDEWRAKTAALPLNSMNASSDKYDGDEALLHATGNAAYKGGKGSLIWEWRFAELDGGLYAMVPWEGPEKPETGARVGDVVAVVEGGKVPLILREKIGPDGKKESAEGNAKWEVVGTAYVHGFMDGLAAEWVERGMLKPRMFDVV